MAFIIGITLVSGFLAYGLSMLVSLRLGVIFWLAVVIFAISLWIAPVGTTGAPDGDGQVPDLRQIQTLILFALPATLGATIGVIGGWIVRRMKETAV